MIDEVREQAEHAIRQLRDNGRTRDAERLERALGSENSGSESSGPESLGPESLGPESLGPESLGPESLGTKIADAFPLALREACQTVLTAIEAIDPNTEMLLEQLRAKIDTLLTPQHPTEPSDTTGAAERG